MNEFDLVELQVVKYLHVEQWYKSKTILPVSVQFHIRFAPN